VGYTYNCGPSSTFVQSGGNHTVNGTLYLL
jgi:hypothetical protein